MDDRSFQYHLEEFKSLKQELEKTFNDSYRALILSVTANAAIYSLLFANSERLIEGAAISNIFVVAPLFVTVVAFWFYRLRRHSINRAIAYLYKLEERFSDGELGWERFYKSDLKYRLFIFRTPFVIGFLFVLQFIAAIYLILFVFFGGLASF